MLTTEQVKRLHRGTYVRKRGTTKLARVAYTCNLGTAIYYYRDCNCDHDCNCSNMGGQSRKRKICREQLEVVGNSMAIRPCLKPGDWVKDIKSEKWYRFICTDCRGVSAEEYNGRFFSEKRQALSQMGQQRQIRTIYDYNLSGNVAIRIPADQIKYLQVGDVIRSVCGERYLVDSNRIHSTSMEYSSFGECRVLMARKILPGGCYGGLTEFRDSDGYTPIEEEGVNRIMNKPKFKERDLVVFVKSERSRRNCKGPEIGDVFIINLIDDGGGCGEIQYYVEGPYKGYFSESELEYQKITAKMIEENIEKLEAQREETEAKLKAEVEMLDHLKQSGQKEITPLELKCFMAIKTFDGKSSDFEKAKAIADLFQSM